MNNDGQKIKDKGQKLNPIIKFYFFSFFLSASYATLHRRLAMLNKQDITVNKIGLPGLHPFRMPGYSANYASFCGKKGRTGFNTI
jgi:hypothetical protein